MRLLGKVFETDHKGLSEYLKTPTKHSIEDMNKHFPGFLAVAIKAVKDVESRRLTCDRIEYKDHKVVAYPSAGFREPASEPFIYIVGN